MFRTRCISGYYGQNMEKIGRHFPCLLYISIQNRKVAEGELEGKKKFQPPTLKGI